MSKRKGVSADEKRVRMLQLFYEKREFFQLKDIEKIAPKEKGIVAQSVKDVVQGLVDDGMIDSDKIGTSIYFWAFPGKNITVMEQRITEASKKLVEAELRMLKVNEELLKEQAGKEETEERQKLVNKISDLKQEESDIAKEVAKYSESDPEVIAQTKNKAEAYKEAANVWTDNIFAIQTWCKRKFDISGDDFNKQFKIPEDLDYVE